LKNDKNNGYKKFKKILISVGVVIVLLVMCAIIFVLIPFIKKMHG